MPKHAPDPHQQLAALAEQLHHAVQAVTEAQHAVETALLTGRATTAARERLSACIQSHREIEMLIEAIQQRLDQTNADAADRRAAELAAARAARLQQFLDRFPPATLPEFAA